MSQLIGLLIALQGQIQLPHLLEAISLPGVRQILLWILQDGLIKLLYCFQVLLGSEVSTAQIVIVGCIIWLQTDGKLMLLDHLVVLFHVVVGCPKVAVINCHCWFETDGL